jgi:hypothetical protein
MAAQVAAPERQRLHGEALGHCQPLRCGWARRLWWGPDGLSRFGARSAGAGLDAISKRVDITYRSRRCPVWIKVFNPASIAVQGRARRELELIHRVGQLLDQRIRLED